MKRKLLLLAMVFACLTSCLGMSMDKKLSHPVYLQASSENQEMIRNRRLATGMSLEEARLSWSAAYLERVRVYTNGRDRYELWGFLRDGKWVYIHITNGIITSISDYR